MNLNSKRWIFFSLIAVFLIYTGIVATTGTEKDNGSHLFTADAAAGKLLFQEYNCGSCHQTYGLGGYMGPDLTNVMSAKGKSEDYVKAMLKTGSVRMPNFKLSDKQVGELVAFLKYLDKTGTSPVLDYKINYDGTFSRKEK